MTILKNRFLAISVIAAIVIMVISAFLPATASIILILTFVILAMVFAVFVIRSRTSGNKRHGFTRAYMYLSVTFLIIAILTSSGYGFFHKDIATALSYDGTEAVIYGRVDKIRYSHSYLSGVEVTVTDIDNEKTDLKAIVEFESDSPIKELDIFSLKGTVSALKEDDTFLLADGFSMKITVTDINSVLTNGRSNPKWYTPFKLISNYLCDIFDSKLTPEASALSKAMLLGDRSSLESETTRDFRRIGISHMLALSGLHVSVILGGIDMVLRWFHVTKKKRSFCLIFCAAAYLAITGFSLSAARAVIMAIIVYLSFVFSDESDSITSLFIAAFLIVAIFPSALLDIGFWMSFCATLSLIIVSELISPLTYKLKKKPLYIQAAVNLLSLVATTIAATVGTVAFMWLVFKEISIISVISNLLFTIPAAAILALSSLLLIFHWVPFLSALLTCLLNSAVEIFLSSSSWLSHLRGITVSLNYDFVKFIIVPMLILTVIFALVYLRRRWIIVMPTVAAIVAFAICLFCYNIGHVGTTSVSYIKNNKSELLTIVNNSGVAVCDMSTGGFEHFRIAYEEAVNQNGTEIEKLILTHYHQYHPNTVKRICDTYMIREVYLPEPQSENDIKWHRSVISSLSDSQVFIIIYNPGESISLGKTCSIEISEYYRIDRSVHPTYYVRVTDSNESFTYLTSSICDSNEFTGIPPSEHIVFGLHGPNIHNPPVYEKYDLKNTRSVILSDNANQWSPKLYGDFDLINANDKFIYSFLLDGK